jgi:dihydrofolate reductase
MATIFYTACSLDGFIADADDNLDWLFVQDIDLEGPMAYPAFVRDVGALAMGATTYQWLLDHTEGWDYQQPTWVFTHRAFPEPRGDVRFVADDVESVHAAMLTAAGDRTVWLVGGGELVGQFADAGLLDEVWVQYAPVTLGGGAPLLPRRLDLRLLDIERNRDFCMTRYAVAGSAP